MTTSNFSTSTIGWVAIVTGVSAILAVIFLTLMATVNMSFGKVNDVFNTIIGISSALLAWMLYAEYHAKSPLLESNCACPCGGWCDLYHCRIGPDHLWLHRLCSGWVVYRDRERFDRLVAGGILLFHATR